MTSLERYNRQVRGSLQALLLAVLLVAGGLWVDNWWCKAALCLAAFAFACASMLMAFIAMGTEKKL